MTMQAATYFLFLLAIAADTAAQADTDSVARIDVFVPGTIEMSGTERLQHQVPDTAITIHIIDGIAQVKATLSRDLPTQAEAARRVALERMKHFGNAEHDRLRHSAEALLQAHQLGVRRYPAVVFDRQWVIYGVTDVVQAYALFRQREIEEYE